MQRRMHKLAELLHTKLCRRNAWIALNEATQTNTSRLAQVNGNSRHAQHTHLKHQYPNDGSPADNSLASTPKKKGLGQKKAFY